MANDSITIFDRALLRQRRARIAPSFAAHDFLFAAAAERLTDRLLDIRRSFPTIANLGAHNGALAKLLPATSTIINLELSEALARQAAAHAPTAVADEEWLPLAPASISLIISNLSLHWVNDLPGALAQVRLALQPDGLLLAALMGGDTLHELRHCLSEAELELTGGLSPRFSPLADVQSMGSLLQRAGFALPVVDHETITVTYENPLRLLHDLRGMGATNATLNRPRQPLRRAVLLRALEKYSEIYAEPDGRIPATFDLIFISGWAPHASQQQPLKPGSAKHRLAEALQVEEHKLKP